MKYLLIILLFASCNNYKQRALTIFLRNDIGKNERTTQIDADSVTSVTKTSAVIWVDGHKTPIYADEIMIANGGAGF